MLLYPFADRNSETLGGIKTCLAEWYKHSKMLCRPKALERNYLYHITIFLKNFTVSGLV